MAGGDSDEDINDERGECIRKIISDHGLTVGWTKLSRNLITHRAIGLMLRYTEISD